MEPYLLTLPVKPKEVGLFQHDGEEVLEGTMKFVDGEREFVAEEGDCFSFDASIPYHGIGQGEKEVKCSMVIYTPA